MDGAIIDLTLPGGDHHVIVYPKADFVPATYTVPQLPGPRRRPAVDDLTANGVQMARFEGFDRRQGHLPRRGPTIAWFNDPAGDILSVVARRHVTGAPASAAISTPAARASSARDSSASSVVGATPGPGP